MSIKSFILSSAGLKNIVTNFQEKEDEFTFINNEQEFKISRIFAEFLSPRVSHIHQCDPTINYLDFSDILSKNKNKSIFSQVLNESTINLIEQMTLGQAIEIDESNSENLLRLSILLGNEELFNHIHSSKNSKKTVDEQLDEIEMYSEINDNIFGQEITKLVDNVSSQITSIDQIKNKKIPRPILYSILGNKNFKLNEQDSLVDLITEIDSENEIKCIELYETIDFSKLSESKFREFLSKFDFNEMTATIWHNLCECFLNNLKPSKSNEKVIEFDGNASRRFSGIINFIRGNNKNNISDEGIISVTASSVEGTHYAENAVDFEIDDFYHSDFLNDWLQYDFKDKKIRPTHYSIKTPLNHSDNQFPMNWCIEVSNTGNKDDWKVIDSRQNVKSVSQKNQSDTFDIKTQLSSNESYRYIRFRSTGDSSGGNNNIVISCLEYFGTLIL